MYPTKTWALTSIPNSYRSIAAVDSLVPHYSSPYLRLARYRCSVRRCESRDGLIHGNADCDLHAVGIAQAILQDADVTKP
jgi:hypothetical protein